MLKAVEQDYNERKCGITQLFQYFQKKTVLLGEDALQNRFEEKGGF
jgi:hypothetical protein